jgi:hypothetical protein
LATITPTVVKTSRTNSQLTIQATLNGNVTNVKSARAQLTTQALLTTSVYRIKSYQSSLVANFTQTTTPVPDGAFLQLIYGTGSTSGYITSSGTSMRTYSTNTVRLATGGTAPNFTYSDITQQIYSGVQTNFWVKLDQPLTSGQQVVLYQSNRNRIIMGYSGYLPGTYGYDSSITPQDLTNQYWIAVQHEFRAMTGEVGGDPRGYFLDLINGGAYSNLGTSSTFDPTVWHNISMPLALAYRSYPGNANYYLSYFDFYDDGAGFALNGVSLTTYYTSDGGITQNGNSTIINGDFIDSLSYAYEGGQGVTNAPGALGGQWGVIDNPVTVYLDQIWISANSSSVAPATEFVRTDVPVATNISTSGLTPGGYQAQVYLTFTNNLLDSAPPSPTWNYTAHNHVVSGYLVKGFPQPEQVTATLTGNARRFRLIQALLTAQVTTTTNNGRIRYISASLTSQVTLTARVNTVKRITLGLTSQATATAQAKSRRVAQASLTSIVSLTTLANKIRATGAQLSVQAQTTTQARKTTRTTSNLQTLAQAQASSVYKFSQRASLTAFATEVTLDTTVKSGRANLTTQATLTSNISRIRNNSSVLTATATSTAQARKTTRTSSNLQVQASLTAPASKTTRTQANLTTVSTVSVTISRIRNDSALLTTQARLQVNPYYLYQNAIRLIGTFGLQTTPIHRTTGRAQLTSTFSTYSNLGKLRYFDAHLTGFLSEVTIGSVLILDPRLMLVVSREIATLIITSEHTPLPIAKENCQWRIYPESRILWVNPESGVNITRTTI